MTISIKSMKSTGDDTVRPFCPDELIYGTFSFYRVTGAVSILWAICSAAIFLKTQEMCDRSIDCPELLEAGFKEMIGGIYSFTGTGDPAEVLASIGIRHNPYFQAFLDKNDLLHG